MTGDPAFTDTEELRLDARGQWLSDGQPVTHAPQIEAFFRHIGRDEQGWFIQIGTDFKRVVVEDTGYFVYDLSGDPDSGFDLRVSDGTVQRLDPKSLAYQPGRLTCLIHGGREVAKFLPNPYLDLLRDLQEDLTAYFLKIEGQTVLIAKK